MTRRTGGRRKLVDFGTDLFLYDGGSCTFIADLDTFKVDASGDGSAFGAIAVSGQSFFVEAWNRTTLTDNNSWIARVGGLP